MEKVRKCILCSSKKIKILEKFEYLHPGNEVLNYINDSAFFRRWILFNHIIKKKVETLTFEVNICSHCGFMFSNPRLSEEEMKLKYDLIKEYNSVKSRVLNFPKKNVVKRAKRIYEFVSKFSNSQNKGIVLDYGGQKGDNLTYFDKNGYECFVVDYEKWVLPGKIKYAGEDLNNVTLNPDYILCNHTLEHVVNPHDFIDSLKSIMDEKTLLYIEVPLGAFYREYINMMKREPLTHVNYFSEQSLTYLLKSAGLKVKEINTSFQHLQTARLWCINAIATKNCVSEDEINPSSTISQLNRKYYYFFILLLDRIFLRLKKIF